MFVCSVCNLFGGNTFNTVLRHIGEYHRHDPGLTIRCGIDRCPQRYTNYESFRSHVYRKHRSTLHIASTAIQGLGGNLLHDHDENSSEDISEDGSISCESTSTSLHHNGAKFILKTREQYRIPQSTLNKMIGDVKGLCEVSHEQMKKKVKACIVAKLSEEEVEEVMECFISEFPLDGLETEYRQLQYYRQHFEYLVIVLKSQNNIIGFCSVPARLSVIR